MQSDPIERLVKELSFLPGIGERTALRLTLHILQQKPDRVLSLAQSLVDVVQNVTECSICCNLTVQASLCSICSKAGRDGQIIAVVSSIQDLMAIESSASFFGRYHVLHGVLEPMSGIGPDKLRMNELKKRIDDGSINEVILATPATIEGEATAIYVQNLIGKASIKFSRITSGVPVGGDLQFADRLSLARALITRQEFIRR